MPIGVFDSGLGGLTVLRGFRDRLPEQGFTYLGDNANAPYGVRDADEIYNLTKAGCQRLFDHGCDLVILACNTASAVALRKLQETWVPDDRRVLGVFVPMIEVLAGRKWADNSPPSVVELKNVAFFATPATVESGAFERELGFRAKGVQVSSQACPGLVEALESGAHGQAADLVRGFVAQVLERSTGPQAAVLGCTHYPLMVPEFTQALPQHTQILSQPEIAAEALEDYLRRHPHFAGSGGIEYLTTGNPAEVSARAQQFLGVEIEFGQA